MLIRFSGILLVLFSSYCLAWGEAAPTHPPSPATEESASDSKALDGLVETELAPAPAEVSPTSSAAPLLAATPVVEPPALEEGRVLLDGFPPERESLAYESFFRNGVVALPAQVREHFVDRTHRMAWEGNTATLETRIPKIVARFRRPPSPPDVVPDPNIPEWFDIHLEFLPRETLIRTTHPRHRANIKGMRLPTGVNDSWRVFLEGQHNAGMAVIIPRTSTVGQYARAVLLCPRYAFRFKRGKRWEIALVESDYRLARTLFAIEGRVAGSALTAGQIGLARAEILTTPNVHRSRGVVDEAYGIDPRAELRYVPLATEHLPDLATDSVTAGIQLKLELQRQAGFKRTSFARDVVWFKPLTLTDNEPWFVKISHATTARVAPGVCYSMFAERSVDHHFTKEHFELPERLKSK